MRRTALGAGLALALVVVAAGVAANAIRVMKRDLAVAKAWDAARAGEWERVLVLTEAHAGADAVARDSAEARCWALLATHRRDECGALLEAILSEEEASAWVPDAMLARLVVARLRDSGRMGEAAALAARASREHPGDLPLRQLELITRGAIEGEAAVLARAEHELGTRQASWTTRVALAIAHRRRADHAASLRVLGEAAPPPEHAVLADWFEERGAALAALGRLDALRAAFGRWETLGGDPVELRARYALRLSVSQLPDREASWIELLDASLREFGDRDATLRAQLAERLIAHHMVGADFDSALAVYDAEASRHPLRGITREQIERSAALGQLASVPAEARGARLAFVAPAQVGGTLRVSAGASAPPDTAYAAHRLAPGERIEIGRELAAWPERWVFRDESGSVRASGSAWPALGAPAEVHIGLTATPRPPRAEAPRTRPLRRPADGRRRVLAIVVDCADWRLTNYLLERGELPALRSLMARGHRAVLDSDPPLTAAAMEALVWPDRGRQVSFVGWVHSLGVELSGLASVGRNPFGFLSGLLPEGQSLFEAVGAGSRVAANMLFTHGMIDAGRHAEVIGPDGARRLAAQAGAYRALRPEERARFPGLGEPPRALSHVESIAAELDAALEIARQGEVDLLVLRLESFDILTHALFSELAGTRQDDGVAPLLAVYRYVDHGLGRLDAALDADDVLVVMSDHGIRTAMEHERDALFVATGAGVPHGRAEGAPALRGVPRVLAGLLGVETDWPETGVAGPHGVAAWRPSRPAGSERAAHVDGSPGRI